MRIKRITISLLALVALLSFASEASAAKAPVWRLTVTSQPTNFAPGEANTGRLPLYDIVATNIGSKATTEPIVITDALPEGITPVLATIWHNNGHPNPCNIAAEPITCEDVEPLGPGENELVEIRVDVGTPAVVPLLNKAEISGGGAASTEQASTVTDISPLPPGFGFLDGPNGTSAVFGDEGGASVTLAGSHPYQVTIDLGLTAKRLGNTDEITGTGGGLRDLTGDLPHGFLANPAASPELCTEAQLESYTCPNDSAVGIVTVLTTGGGAPQPSESPLFNMVPPAGEPAEFGFDAAAVGLFAHLRGEVRNDGDYGLSATTNDILARSVNPLLAAQAQLWGDPSDSSHDGVRGACDEKTHNGKETCPVTQQEKAFLTMPSACSSSLEVATHADSWEEPGQFRSAGSLVTDPGGTSTGVDDCGGLKFEPTIEAQPTTGLADSPSGLDVKLHQVQEDKLSGRATANLKDATITLPEGITVNPSQAAGLGACTPEEIGLESPIGQFPIRFSKGPASCPDAAKLGNVSIDTPLLDRPLPGSIYIAKPFANPFGSLLALYLTVDDPQTGVVAKLAGRVHADPVTGRLTTSFEENPELPLEEVHVHLFEGPRAPLRTPPACGAYVTKSDLTPWSAPDGLDVHLEYPFQVTASPRGGTCPASAQAAPNAPSFEAGTLTPRAGAYSPLTAKLEREDGTQPPGGFEATMPPGLLAKLAGVPYCSEADIARAQSRNHPNEGAIELASPSCPAASEVGTVDVGAGAGPTPFHASGHVYLAGPYKGAPLSAVVITPAVAGPFDLGAVVVRAAIYVDPERAQARAVTDPLPTILDGIPLDLRSTALRLDRPNFMLNPTNCEPMSIDGKLTSVFGQVAALSNRFQVGGCNSLAFKPRLSIRLRGGTKRAGHPALTGILRATPGQANLKRLSVTLPRSEFLDQGHIGTVCTRVQFSAGQCPAASVYGSARVFTPLLDAPLEGPVYLRSSSHELPDLVIDLHGQVDVVLDGRIDSVNGRIRTTFESAPDAPFTKAVLQMEGGRKGLLVNSADLCKLAPSATRATAKLKGQNGTPYDLRPVVHSDCAKASKKKAHRGRRR